MSKASEATSVRTQRRKNDDAEEIIYSTEVIEHEEADEEEVEEVEEVEEIVEIIEEIEEIEEIVEEEEEEGDEEEFLQESIATPAIATREVEELDNRSHENYSESQDADESHNESGREDDAPPTHKMMKNTKHHRFDRNSSRRSHERSKRIAAYDVDEDWEDEDRHERRRNLQESRKMRIPRENVVDTSLRTNKNHSVNGKRSLDSRGDDYSSSPGRSNVEPVYKIAKNRSSNDYGDSRDAGNSMDVEEDDEDEEDEEDSHQEIVKSLENNLVYTVLGSKKSGNSNVKAKRESTVGQNQDNSSYMKMERLDEDEPDNMETVYVAQATGETGDDYQYEEQAGDNEEQYWETGNEANAEEHEDEETTPQDQIFLHEDENGQLYFKDDNGTLQPVYLTADGNYAIAENSGDDDNETHDNTNNRQQASPSSSTGVQVAKNFEEDSFIVPELDGVASGSNANEADNEDNNTVTISLIISEDENGQKRTQVIIPTNDNLKCELCAKTFKTPFQLLRHNRLKHAREEDITTRNFPCDLCPKRYSDQNTLARHRKTHIGDRPFGCLECGKSFPTSTALRRHLTQHNSQSRPLTCIYCGRRFLEKSALTKHEQSHLAGDQRTHTCDVCHKSFLEANDLHQHKKNHDPDKKYDCEVCGREFNRLNNLQRHMMVHKQKQGQNQEILACDVCGITYKFMSSLTRHMVTSHMNPEKLRQQAEEQRKKRENNYRRYLENRKMYETQHTNAGFPSSAKRGSSGGYRSSNDNDEDTA